MVSASLMRLQPLTAAIESIQELRRHQDPPQPLIKSDHQLVVFLRELHGIFTDGPHDEDSPWLFVKQTLDLLVDGGGAAAAGAERIQRSREIKKKLAEHSSLTQSTTLFNYWLVCTLGCGVGYLRWFMRNAFENTDVVQAYYKDDALLLQPGVIGELLMLLSAAEAFTFRLDITALQIFSALNAGFCGGRAAHGHDGGNSSMASGSHARRSLRGSVRRSKVMVGGVAVSRSVGSRGDNSTEGGSQCGSNADSQQRQRSGSNMHIPQNSSLLSNMSNQASASATPVNYALSGTNNMSHGEDNSVVTPVKHQHWHNETTSMPGVAGQTQEASTQTLISTLSPDSSGEIFPSRVSQTDLTAAVVAKLEQRTADMRRNSVAERDSFRTRDAEMNKRGEELQLKEAEVDEKLEAVSNILTGLRQLFDGLFNQARQAEKVNARGMLPIAAVHPLIPELVALMASYDEAGRRVDNEAVERYGGAGVTGAGAGETKKRWSATRMYSDDDADEDADEGRVVVAKDPSKKSSRSTKSPQYLAPQLSAAGSSGYGSINGEGGGNDSNSKTEGMGLDLRRGSPLLASEGDLSLSLSISQGGTTPRSGVPLVGGKGAAENSAPIFYEAQTDALLIKAAEQAVNDMLIVDVVHQPPADLKVLAEAQQNQCAECQSAVRTGQQFVLTRVVQAVGRLFKPVSRGQFCHYSGKIYCAACCHYRMIPSRIVQHWDFSYFTVGRNSAHNLAAAIDNPEFTFSQIERHIRNDPEWPLMRRYRAQLFRVHFALTSCSRFCGSHEKIVDDVSSMTLNVAKSHYFTMPNRLSLRDLTTISAKKFHTQLQRLFDKCMTHVTNTCSECRQRCTGVCVVCKDSERRLLRPAYGGDEREVKVCGGCRGLMHVECYDAMGCVHCATA